MSISGHKVEVLAWSLNGIARRVHKVIAKTSDVTDGSIPRELVHVGVAVYKRFYHFNTSGIHINIEIPVGYKLCGHEHQTSKSQDEFEKWITEIRDTYRSSNYNMIDNNCINFAKDVCEFLEVPFDGPQTNLYSWLREHKNLLRRLEKSMAQFLRVFGVPSKKNRTVVDSACADNSDDSDFSDEENEWENYLKTVLLVAIEM